MNGSDPIHIAVDPRPARASSWPEARTAEPPSRTGLTWGQKWLAAATAPAVLVSGLNALVQITRTLIECWGRHG